MIICCHSFCDLCLVVTDVKGSLSITLTETSGSPIKGCHCCDMVLHTHVSRIKELIDLIISKFIQEYYH